MKKKVAKFPGLPSLSNWGECTKGKVLSVWNANLVKKFKPFVTCINVSGMVRSQRKREKKCDFSGLMGWHLANNAYTQKAKTIKSKNG